MNEIIYNVGDKIVCVNTEPLKGNGVSPELFLNYVYSVIGICKDKAGNQHLDVGIRTNLSFVRSYETEEKLPYVYGVEWEHEIICAPNASEWHDGENIIHWCHPCRFKPHSNAAL